MATMVSTITDTFKTIKIRSREMTPKCIARKKSKLTKHSIEESKRLARKPNKKAFLPASKNNDVPSSSHGFDADATMEQGMTGSSSSEDKCALSPSLSFPCSSLEVPPACITFNFPAIEWASENHQHHEDGFATPTTDEEDLYQLLRNQSTSFPKPRRSSDTAHTPCGKGSLVRSLAFLKELCELSNATTAPVSHQVMV